MTAAPSRASAAALGLAAALLPLVYLPDVLPPLFGLRPFAGLFPPLFDFTLLPRLFLLQVLLPVGVAGWAVAAFRRPAPAQPLPVALPMLCYAGISVCSAFWAVNPVEGTIHAARTLTYLLLALAAAYALSAPSIRAVCTAGAAAGAAVSCIGIAQYLGWGFADIPTVGNPSATFGYRNFAAAYLVAAIPPAAAFAWTSRKGWAQAAWGLSATLMSVFLIYTRTRGAWAGLAGACLAGVGLLLWFRLKHRTDPIHPGRSPVRLLIAALCILLALAGSRLQPHMERQGKFRFDERKADALTTLSTTFSPGDARGRLTVWRHTLELIRDHPLLGVGLGSWQYVYPRYDRGDWITHEVAPQRPHNDLLWIAAETGLPGLACYLWMLCALAAAVWRALKTRPDRPETLWAVGIALGLLALLGHSLFSFPRERAAPSMLFWMGLGFAARLAAEPAPQRARAPGPLFGAGIALSIPLLLCALALTYRLVRFDAHYLQALAAWRRADWAGLLARADRALAWGPLNHRALLLKGLAQHNLGDPAAAVSTYTAALRYHPNDGHAALGAAYTDLGRHDRAAEHYRIERLLYPRSATAALDLAGALERLGRADEAIAVYREALVNSPEFADIYIRLGKALQASGNLKGAREAFEGARRLAPDDPRSHNNLGVVLARLGRPAEAETAYLKALEIDPDYARAHHNLGDLYASTGDTARAIRAYETFIRAWPGDPRFVELARQKIRNLKGTP